MGRKRSPLEAVLADSTNIAASTVQADVGEQDQGKRMPVTFSRKGKVTIDGLLLLALPYRSCQSTAPLLRILSTDG